MCVKLIIYKGHTRMHVKKTYRTVYDTLYREMFYSSAVIILPTEKNFIDLPFRQPQYLCRVTTNGYCTIAEGTSI